jgi:hypothetical protein
LGGVGLVLSIGWLTLIIYPQPLFAHSLKRGNLVLLARAPLQEDATSILDEVQGRVSRSPLYEPTRPYYVFLCGTPEMFAFLTFGKRSTGLTNSWRNIFIRSADVAHNRVFGRDGHAKSGERTLTYYIAHEVTHAMTLDRLGWWHCRHLASFQKEGYADYVGYSHSIDFVSGREALRRNDPEMDVRRSGVYKRYELLVAYLLERRAFSVKELLARRLDQAAIERQLEFDPNL